MWRWVKTIAIVVAGVLLVAAAVGWMLSRGGPATVGPDGLAAALATAGQGGESSRTVTLGVDFLAVGGRVLCWGPTRNDYLLNAGTFISRAASTKRKNQLFFSTSSPFKASAAPSSIFTKLE